MKELIEGSREKITGPGLVDKQADKQKPEKRKSVIYCDMTRSEK